MKPTDGSKISPHHRLAIGLGIIILVLAGLITSCSTLKLNPFSLNTQVAPLPFNIPISYDDFTFDAHLNKVIIPSGETGDLALIDPKNITVQLISGFSAQTDPNNPVVGTTSAAVGGGYLYAVDQNTTSIKTVDLSSGAMVASTPLQDAPDYIRYVSATGELWVAEKNSNQIEVFSISQDTPPVLQSTLDIPIPNGPEALVIDDARGLAFTNRPKQSLTDVINVLTHSVTTQWGNGCSSAKGMAIDEPDGYLFVACGEGKLVAMDINNDGYQITSQNYGAKLDFVAYNAALHHVYLPSSVSGILAIFQLQTLVPTPQPTNTLFPGEVPTAIPTDTPGPTPTPTLKTSLVLLGTADTAVKSKCVTTDNLNNIWVCDPTHGQVFIIHDSFGDSSSLP
jgi:hypothetical protein